MNEITQDVAEVNRLIYTANWMKERGASHANIQQYIDNEQEIYRLEVRREFLSIALPVILFLDLILLAGRIVVWVAPL